MRTRRRDESGAITPFVVIVALGMLLLGGLVVDGGRQLNAKGRAVAYAQEAARAGSQAVDVNDPELDLLIGDAIRAAQTYCRQAQANDPQLIECVAHTTTVTLPAGSFRAVAVRTRVRINSIVLGLIMKPTLEATGRAAARPVNGITGPDDGKLQTIPPPSVNSPGAGEPSVGPPPPEVTVPPCQRVTETPKPTDPSPSGTASPSGGGGGGGKPPKPSKSPSPTLTATPCPSLAP